MNFVLINKKLEKYIKVWTYKGIVNILFPDNNNEKSTKIEHYDDLWELFPEV